MPCVTCSHHLSKETEVFIDFCTCNRTRLWNWNDSKPCFSCSYRLPIQKTGSPVLEFFPSCFRSLVAMPPRYLSLCLPYSGAAIAKLLAHLPTGRVVMCSNQPWVCFTYLGFYVESAFKKTYQKEFGTVKIEVVILTTPPIKNRLVYKHIGVSTI